MKNFRTRPLPTFKYFYIGCGILFAGIGSIASSYLIIGSILSIFGMFLVLSINGVIIDANEQKVKVYFNFLFLKLGKWIPLNHFTHVVLGPNSSSQAIGRTSTTFRTNSYSVALLDKNSKLSELQEFTEYKLAEEFSQLVSKKIGLPIINKQEIIKQKAAQRRQFRK